MSGTRYFTCMAKEDIPAEWELKAALKIFHDCDDFVGPISGETGIAGLKIDFKQGLRLLVPQGAWHVRITDFDTEMVFFDEDVSDLRLISLEKYYIHWSIEIWLDSELVFTHVFDPEGQQVIFYCLHTALGDNLAFLPYARAFQEKYHAKVCCHVPEYMREITARLYPEISQVERATEDTYGVFFLGAWYTRLGVPVDIRNYPLAELGGSMVGIFGPVPLPVFRPTRPRWIRERYVCLGVQASTLSKGWHYPGGWDSVVDYLMHLGYRVFCIDRHTCQQERDYVTIAPAGAEDMTGDYSIMDRADMLYYADFFIGLSSGLAWVAHDVGCPVILISGMTHGWHEFHTPYRVINRQVCHGCFNDVRVRFKDCFCPYHEGTERELECSKRISPRQVMAAIDELRKDCSSKSVENL